MKRPFNRNTHKKKRIRALNFMRINKFSKEWTITSEFLVGGCMKIYDFLYEGNRYSPVKFKQS